MRTKILTGITTAALTIWIGLSLVNKPAPEAPSRTPEAPAQQRVATPAVTSDEFFSSLHESGSEDLAARISLAEKLAALLRWTEIDAPAAFAWIGKLNASQRMAAHKEMGTIWVRNDTAGYTAWLRKQAGNPKRLAQGQLSTAIGYLARYDLASAIEIGALVRDVRDLDQSVKWLTSVEQIREVATAIDLLPKIRSYVEGGGSDGSNPIFGNSTARNRDEPLRRALAYRWEKLARISHTFRVNHQRTLTDTRRAPIPAVGGIYRPSGAGIKRNAVAVEVR